MSGESKKSEVTLEYINGLVANIKKRLPPRMASDEDDGARRQYVRTYLSHLKDEEYNLLLDSQNEREINSFCEKIAVEMMIEGIAIEVGSILSPHSHPDREDNEKEEQEVRTAWDTLATDYKNKTGIFEGDNLTIGSFCTRISIAIILKNRLGEAICKEKKLEIIDLYGYVNRFLNSLPTEKIRFSTTKELLFSHWEEIKQQILTSSTKIPVLSPFEEVTTYISQIFPDEVGEHIVSELRLFSPQDKSAFLAHVHFREKRFNSTLLKNHLESAYIKRKVELCF